MYDLIPNIQPGGDLTNFRSAEATKSSEVATLFVSRISLSAIFIVFPRTL